MSCRDFGQLVRERGEHRLCSRGRRPGPTEGLGCDPNAPDPHQREGLLGRVETGVRELSPGHVTALRIYTTHLFKCAISVAR